MNLASEGHTASGVWQSSPWQISDDGQYDSPKLLRSTCASCSLNSSASMPRYSGITAFGGTFDGSGFRWRSLDGQWTVEVARWSGGGR